MIDVENPPFVDHFPVEFIDFSHLLVRIVIVVYPGVGISHQISHV